MERKWIPIPADRIRWYEGQHSENGCRLTRSGDSTNSAEPLVIFLHSTRLMNSPRAPSETFLPAKADTPRSTTIDSSRMNPCCYKSAVTPNADRSKPPAKTIGTVSCSLPVLFLLKSAWL